MPTSTPLQPAASLAAQMERSERQYDTAAMAAFVQEKLQQIQGNAGQQQLWSELQAALQKPATYGICLNI